MMWIKRIAVPLCGVGMGLFALAGCGQTSGSSTLTIEATGAVEGLVYRDLNGNGLADAQDEPADGVPVQLLTWGSGAVVDETESDGDGRFSFTNAPVGTYQVGVGFNDLGDTLQVVDLDSTALVIPADSMATAVFGVSYKVFTVEEARQLPVGTPVFVEAVVLAGPLTWADRSGHFREDDFAIRATGMVIDALFPGDTVRMRGRTGTTAGQPVITDGKAYVLAGFSTSPLPLSVSTAEAAGARGGAIDADLVRIQSAVVADTFRIDGDLVATVNDGSGILEIVLDKDVAWLDNVAPGATFGFATGLLIPVEGSSLWQLKPRTRFDISVSP
jgi:hypothetical protein